MELLEIKKENDNLRKKLNNIKFKYERRLEMLKKELDEAYNDLAKLKEDFAHKEGKPLKYSKSISSFNSGANNTVGKLKKLIGKKGNSKKTTKNFANEKIKNERIPMNSTHVETRNLMNNELCCLDAKQSSLNKTNGISGCKIKNNNENISNEIFDLEREISDINHQYKSLLNSHDNALNLNSNLNELAELLEKKNEQLFELKKQQKLALQSYRI